MPLMRTVARPSMTSSCGKLSTWRAAGRQQMHQRRQERHSAAGAANAEARGGVRGGMLCYELA